MRALYCFLSIVVLLSTQLGAQIPNPGFESWVGNEPVGWFTTNFICGTVIKPSSSSYSGNWAMKGQVESFYDNPCSPVFTSGSMGGGFPVSQPYASLTGYYKFNPVGNDVFGIYILMKNDSGYMGGGGIELGSASSFTFFSIPIEYLPDEVPNLCIIGGAIEGGNGADDPTVGSEFYLDDLAFSGTTSVGDHNTVPNHFSLKQNHPNPFNPTTTIHFEIPRESFVRLEVTNLLGQEVAILVDEKREAGRHAVEFTGSNLESGVYFYRLRAGEYTQTRKLVLMK